MNLKIQKPKQVHTYLLFMYNFNVYIKSILISDWKSWKTETNWSFSDGLVIQN